MKREFSRQIFEESSYIKFHQNPFSGVRVPCGRTGGQTDVTKLVVTFRNSADSSKNEWLLWHVLLLYMLLALLNFKHWLLTEEMAVYRRNM